MNIYEKLAVIQNKLKVPKNRPNEFSGFMYRSAEDIQEAVKPLLYDVGAVLLLTDKVKEINGRFYVVAKAKLIDITSGERVAVQAMARETDSRAKFDVAQLTGAASSYARKYALNGLFCLDDTADSDTLSGADEKDSAKKAQSKTPAAVPGQQGGKGSAAAPAPAAEEKKKPSNVSKASKAAGAEQEKAKAQSKQTAKSGGADTLINQVQAQLLEKALERKGKSLQGVLEQYQLYSLQELVENDYRAVMAALQKLPDVKQE